MIRRSLIARPIICSSTIPLTQSSSTRTLSEPASSSPTAPLTRPYATYLPQQSNMATTTTSQPSHPPADLLPLLHEVTTLLKSRSETLSVVETAAGGLVSSSVLTQPGASAYYKGGLTLYTLPSRIAYAGWTQDTIAAYRGPTTDIVSGLARHVRKDLESTYTLAESGTAGPTGGNTENRKPGYVALAVDCEAGTFVRELNTGLGGDRVGNMVRFAMEALRLLRDVLKGEAKL